MNVKDSLSRSARFVRARETKRKGVYYFSYFVGEGSCAFSASPSETERENLAGTDRGKHVGHVSHYDGIPFRAAGSTSKIGIQIEYTPCDRYLHAITASVKTGGR